MIHFALVSCLFVVFPHCFVLISALCVFCCFPCLSALSYVVYSQPASACVCTLKTKHTIEASHNGYIKNYKKIIKRKISFQESENYLIGEDSIISSTSKNKEVVFHIRFHVLPKINITQTNNRRSIILKTEKNKIWLFKANKDLVLEESVYMDKNNVKETKQIVIKGITRNSREKVNWSLSKK